MPSAIHDKQYVHTSYTRFSSETCTGLTAMAMVKFGAEKEGEVCGWMYLGFPVDYYQCTTHSLPESNSTVLNSI
jgi:hypothetical protein